MGPERRRYTFQGRVQGVGFRATAHRLAGDFVLGGYVRNQDDGTVELVAEGEPAVIDAYIVRLRGELGPRITRATFETEPIDPAPAVREFRIRH